MADLHVRVDEEVKVRLDKEARDHGLSLNKYVGSVLRDHAYNPSIRSIEDKYANLAKDITALYEQTINKTTEALAENTYLLRKLMDHYLKGE